MIKLSARLPSLLAAAALLACGDEDLGPRVPASLLLTPAAPRVFVGESLPLEASVLDAAGQEIPDQAVTFHSSDATVLTVSDAGVLTSVGPTGRSLITVASGGITAEVEAEVVLPPSAVVASPRTLDLDTGEAVAVSVTVTDENAEPIPGAAVSLSSTSAAVRVEKVDGADGLVLITGLKVGAATVTLTSGGLAAEVTATVSQYPSSAVIEPATLLFPTATGSQHVEATLLDRTGDPMAEPATFTWSTSRPSVVQVGAGGVVAAIGVGSATVTATTGTFSATLGVFVGPPPDVKRLARVPFAGATGVAVTQDGRYFVSGFDRFGSGALPDFAFPDGYFLSAPSPGLAVTEDGSRGYVLRTSAVFGPGADIADLTTNTRVDFAAIHSGLPSSIAVSADGSVLTVGTSEGVEARRLPDKTAIGAVAVGPIDKVTPHPSKPLFYASGLNGAFEIDAGPLGISVTRRFPGSATAHAVSPDGTRLYTVNTGGGVRVWNLETGAEEPTFRAVSGTDLAVSPNGRFLYVIFGSNHIVDGSRLYILDRESGALLQEVVLGGVARRIAMFGSGVTLITNEGEPDGWVDFLR